MRNKMRKATCLMLAVLCMAGISVTAYASGGDEAVAPPSDETVVETENPVSDEPGESVEIPFSYTIDGDGNLVITIDGVSETVKITATGTVVTGGSCLNVRTGAGLDYEIIDQLRPGEEVTVIGSEGEWYEVIVPEKKGYVHSDYLKIAENNGQNIEIDADILEMVDYFMEQGMTEEQANDLANSEWQARKTNQVSVEGSSEPVIELPVEEVPPVQASGNGDMPDPSMSIEAMNAYGYTDSDMLPLSKERALELFERDVPIYMLYDGNTEAMAFEAEDIVLFSGCFGITREDWDAIKNQIPPMDMEMVRKKREQAFHESAGDTYAIYQLKRDDATADLRFMNSEWLQKKGIEPQYENYELVYTGTLSKEGSQIEKLENLYRIFNVEHPQDFTGHSLSISDIVALKQVGVVSYHYVDSVGYRELTNFRNTDNHLKNAEMQLEDDYGMIDGVINNGPKESVKPAPKKEEVKTKKPSVLAKLRKYQEEDRKSATQHRSAERDL